MKKESQIKPIKLVRKKTIKDLAKLAEVSLTSDAKQRLSADLQRLTFNILKTANVVAKESGRKRITEDDLVLARMAEQSIYEKGQLQESFKAHYEKAKKKKPKKK